MTLKRWLFVALAMTVTASVAHAQTSHCWDLPDKPGCCDGSDKMVQHTYPVADLVASDSAERAHLDELIKTITQVVEPKSWQEHGGRGTIDYFPPLGTELIVLQTAEVHERLNTYLMALRHFGAHQAKNANAFPTVPHCLQPCAAMASAAPAAGSACACPQCRKGVDGACSCPNCKSCDSCNCGKSKGCESGDKAKCCESCGKAKCCDSCDKHAADHAQPKQYAHFVLQNVTINAMGVSAKIKRIRVMYKGDGIENDVAKCALTNGESEKKVDSAMLYKLLEKLNAVNWNCPTAAPCCVPGALIGASLGALAGSAVAPALPSSTMIVPSYMMGMTPVPPPPPPVHTRTPVE